MADQSTTDTGSVNQAPIKDQTTLEEALQNVTPAETEASEGESVEPTEKTEEKQPEKQELILGKYKSVDDLKTAYNSLRDQYQKTVESQKELKKQLEGRTLEKLKGATYDEQLEYMLTKLQEQEAFKEELLSKMQSQSEMTREEQDAQAIEEFISANPHLKETGFGEEFKLVASHPSMREYSLESIFESRFKPKLEKLQGIKITTKERKVLSSKPTQVTNNFADVSKMSKSEYEKYRQEIFKNSGIK